LISINEEFDVLRQIQKATSQKSLATEIGYSVGKVNYIIKSLAQKGLIKSERFLNSKNKLQYKYLLTEIGIKEKLILTEKFIEQKKKEYDELLIEQELNKKMYESENK